MFVTERGGPMTTDNVRSSSRGLAGRRACPSLSIHTCCATHADNKLANDGMTRARSSTTWVTETSRRPSATPNSARSGLRTSGETEQQLLDGATALQPASRGQ